MRLLMKILVAIGVIILCEMPAYSLPMNLEQIILNDPVLKEKYGNPCTNINGVEFSSLPKPEVSLQKLIDAAEDNATLNITTRHEDLNETLNITKNLTVNGIGFVVADGQRNCEILHIENPYATVVINNIKFVNGEGEHGGAIDSDARGLVLENCTLEHNIAYNGSCVRNLGEKLTIKGCKISNNFAADDGAIMTSDEDSSISDSTFNNNTALGKGGCIYSNVPDGQPRNSNIYFLNLTNCVFTENNAAEIGAAVYSKDNYINIDSCKVFRNNGTSSIEIEDGQAIIKNSNISQNLGAYNGLYAAMGSGIELLNCSAFIDNCTIVGNKAFYQKISSCGGGGAGVFISSSNVTINDTVIIGNVAASCSGIMVNGGSTLVMNRGELSQNIARYVYFRGETLNGNAAGLSILSADKVTLYGVTIADNCADNRGAAISNRGILTLIGTNTFSNNTATLGGAIYNDITGIVKIDDRTIFESNSAQDGGAIYNEEGGVIELKGSPSFTNNEAIDTGEYDYSEGMGGAIFNGGNLTIENAVFSGNKAISGSAIWSEGNLTDTNSYYHSNHATAAGTIFFNQPLSKPKLVMTLNKPSITGNLVNENGGGIYTSGCIFVNGGAIRDNQAKVQGGAIYCIPQSGSTVTPEIYLNGVTLSNNTATQDGGAIYSTLKAILKLDRATRIYDNTAGANGGGVFLNAQSSIDTGFASINSNVAKGRGGGIYLTIGSKMVGNERRVRFNKPDNICIGE